MKYNLDRFLTLRTSKDVGGCQYNFVKEQHFPKRSCS